MKALLSFLLLAGIADAQVRAAAEVSGGNLPIQRLGANDLVAISVYDAAELTRTVRVGADGFIRLPMLHQRIKAEGSMPAELEGAIADALKAEHLIVDPFVTVTVAEYNSRPISVMGSVRKPLTFQAVGPVTLLDALARAEGLLPDAGPEILLTRLQRSPGGQSVSLVERIPLKGLIDAGDSKMNFSLTGGEEIRVPEAGKVFVLGNVKKPGAFAVQDRSGTTILKVLAMAEGLLPYAAKKAYIYRRDQSGVKKEVPIELSAIMQRKSPDVPLTADDILYIPDAKGTRATITALEKLILFGSSAGSALIYAGVRP